MPLKYDPFLSLADAVAGVLAGTEPMRPKEIAKRLREIGWGYPPQSAVNKVLTQHLSGRVQQIATGYWRLSPDSVKPE